MGRRVAAWVCVAGWLGLCAGVLPAQVFLTDDVPDRVVVPVPRPIAQALDESQASIAMGQYHAAVKMLQSVLDNPEDYFLDETCTTSAKRQAFDALKSLPESGRQAYELEFGNQAASQLQQARKSGDAALLKQMARRYSFTQGGREALQQLAARAFDSGDFLTAALSWEQLEAAHPGSLAASEQVQLAAAWDQAGRHDLGRQRLKAVSAPAVTLKGQRVPVPAPKERELWLTSHFPRWPALAPALTEWTELRGGGNRHGLAQSTGPVGGPAWRFPVIAPSVHDSPPQVGEPFDLRHELETELEEMATDDKLTIPAAAPIVAKNVVVYRSLEGLSAVDQRSGALLWRAVLSDSQLERQREQLALAQQRRVLEDMSAISQRLMITLREQLFRDATRGTLSTDGQYVFAVEPCDPSLASMPDLQRGFVRNSPVPQPPVNKLVAYELEGGRLVTEIGGRREEPALPFGGVFFFGPPLVHNERLFCLAELNRELLLLQLRLEEQPAPRFVLEWSQPITAPERLLFEASLRRLAGLVPSVAGPLLICPTAAGLVAAVDPGQHQLRWGYQYESLEAMRTMPTRQQFIFRRGVEFDEDSGRWLESAPVIASGRVLLTPRDSAELHCVDLLDGTLLWKRPRGQGLFIAGVANEHVVIVQRNSLEAYNLADGKPAWSDPVMIPTPSGRGLLVEGRYLLPLSTGEIATFELNNGQILARSRLLDGQMPGNLAASRGALVSQSLYDLLGFVSEQEIEAQVSTRLAANAQDPQALSWRGELRLHRGELDAGLNDLRAAQQLEPSPRTSTALAAALLQALRTDFPRHRGAADELDKLTLDRKQRHEFLRSFAEALSREGRHLEALRQYLRLAESAGDDPLWERAEDVLSARSDRVVQGRVQSLYASASADDRRAMDAEIEHALLGRDQDSIELDRRFLRYFSQHPAASQVRRRVLDFDLEHDRAQGERLAQLLAFSAVESEAGYATARLAEALRKEPRSPAAQPWLRRLNSEFAEVTVLDGKTGRELLESWEIDLDELSSTAADNWPEGSVDVEHKKRLQTSRRIRLAEVVGQAGPRLDGWSFEVLDDAEQLLIARDGAGRMQWRVAIPTLAEDRPVTYATAIATPRVFIAGPWLALSIGTKFSVWELPAGPALEPKLRWQHSLTPPHLAGVAALYMRPDLTPHGRRRLRSADATGMDPPGQLIGINRRNVVYQMGDRLYAADPSNGVAQWVRQGIPRQFEGTVSDDVIALLETNTGTARIYRTVDGQELGRPSVGSPDDWLWYRGGRLLSIIRAGDRQRLTMRHLPADEPVWTLDIDVLARCQVVDDRELLVLHASGQLQCVSLETGKEAWKATLPPLNAIEYLWARRIDNRYELVIRQPVPAAGFRRIIRYDTNQIDFSGKVAAVEGTTGRVLWTCDVGPTAFDVIQPARTPILPFVGRVDPPPQLARNDGPNLPGLAATFVDSRTGDVLYQTWESAVPNMYQFELAGERRQVIVNFHAWQLEFTFGAGE